MRLSTVVRNCPAWLFRKMVRSADDRVAGGDIVRVIDREGRFVAYAFWHPHAEIALRTLSFVEKPVFDEFDLAARVERAISLRRDVLALDDVTDAYRAVFSEADGLPGLIVDRYGDVVSCQVSSLGIYRNFSLLADRLREHLGVRVVHVSADPRVAKREEFPVPDSAGDAARTTVSEHGLSFHVDPAAGHKTGFFLDQRDARARIRSLARGRRVIDLFSYTGGFALNAITGQAKQVIAVDLDEDAVAQGQRNAELNGIDGPLHFVHDDAFRYLRSLGPGEFDLAIVDPAKQAERPGGLERALAYYADLNRLVFQKARPGALVLTCSCTGVVSESDFLGMLQRAAEDVGRDVTVLEIRGAPADHPVPLSFPRARYLKAVLVRVD